MPKTPAKKGFALAFDEFSTPHIRLPVNNIRQGYGSAVFLEFGRSSDPEWALFNRQE